MAEVLIRVLIYVDILIITFYITKLDTFEIIRDWFTDAINKIFRQ